VKGSDTADDEKTAASIRRYIVNGAWNVWLLEARYARFGHGPELSGSAANCKFDDSPGRNTYRTEPGRNKRQPFRRADAGPSTADCGEALCRC
jgi:hypothetical protein